LSLSECRYQWLGQVDYQAAWDIQKNLIEARASDEGKDSLLFLEHPPTYTLGRGGDQTHLLVPEERLRELGAVLHRVDRGGDITFHGPGQLVGYPILDLNRLGISVIGYVRGLEEVLIRALSVFGVDGARIEGFPGVWVGKEKVAAIGVKVNARKITSHGFALNVDNDLGYFSYIVPCGLKGKGVTSLARLKGEDIRVSDVLKEVVQAFGEVFSMVMREQNGGDRALG
jgi:lipoyl(octanoyl) transferase